MLNVEHHVLNSNSYRLLVILVATFVEYVWVLSNIFKSVSKTSRPRAIFYGFVQSFGAPSKPC